MNGEQLALFDWTSEGGIMVTLNTIPEIADIAHYGGDTLNVEVRAPAELTDGMNWAAQVRTTRESDLIDATFVIQPPVIPGGAAHLMLSSVDVSRLIGTAPVVMKRLPTGLMVEVKRYTGEWDCQVYHPTNPDPVKTLAQGKLTIEIDVTRLP